jgi:hypothetical protein
MKAENVDLFVAGKKIATVSDVELDYSSEPEPRAAMLGPVEFFETVLSVPLDARQRALLMAAITPDGVPYRIRAGLGVFVWRMLGELQAPLLRRHANGAMWRQALRRNQAGTLEYLMARDADGVPTPEDALSQTVEDQR